MSKRTIGMGLIVLGVLVLIGSLGADVVGLGGAPGIGWKQWVGAGIGLIVAIAGAWSLRGDQAK
jgi:hypothetical protein